LAIFESSAQVYQYIGGLFYKLKEDSEVSSQVKATNLVIRFSYFEPDAKITIDARSGREEIIYGNCDLIPDVELTMSSDIAHEFWLGRLNVMAAITKRQIIPSGSLSKIMKLIPIIKLAIKIYPQHLKEIGYDQQLRVES
jgi:hypothetical protein